MQRSWTPISKGQPIESLITRAAASGRAPFAFVTGYGPKVLSKTFEETVTISKPFSAEQLLAVTEVLVYLRGAGSGRRAVAEKADLKELGLDRCISAHGLSHASLSIAGDHLSTL